MMVNLKLFINNLVLSLGRKLQIFAIYLSEEFNFTWLLGETTDYETLIHLIEVLIVSFGILILCCLIALIRKIIKTIRRGNIIKANKKIATAIFPGKDQHLNFSTIKNFLIAIIFSAVFVYGYKRLIAPIFIDASSLGEIVRQRANDNITGWFVVSALCILFNFLTYIVGFRLVRAPESTSVRYEKIAQTKNATRVSAILLIMYVSIPIFGQIVFLWFGSSTTKIIFNMAIDKQDFYMILKKTVLFSSYVYIVFSLLLAVKNFAFPVIRRHTGKLPKPIYIRGIKDEL